MAQLEVLQESHRLNHADVSIGLEANVRHRPTWVRITDDVLGDDVETWNLQEEEQSASASQHKNGTFAKSGIYQLAMCGSFVKVDAKR